MLPRVHNILWTLDATLNENILHDEISATYGTCVGVTVAFNMK